MSLFGKPLTVNPFTDDYWQSELQAYGLQPDSYQMNHVSVDWFKISGRCDDYLNVNMRFIDTEMPRLCINEHLWMSLTPMEIQSAALALFRAQGHVITGGLGLGYFALRAAAKPEVHHVTVFEQETLVIDWFKRAFENRPELAKIEIVPGDIHTTFKGYKANFVFMDIYPDMLGDSTLTDLRAFKKRNEIKRYHFWGYEKAVLELLSRKMIKHRALLMGSDLGSYFRFWCHTPVSAYDGSKLSDYSRLSLDLDFLKKVRRSLNEYPL